MKKWNSISLVKYPNETIMKKLAGLLLLFVFLSSYPQTKSIQKTPPLSPAEPEKMGMSPERLERIDRMLMDAIEEDQIPGAVALIARNGHIVYHKAFGMADVKEGEKLEKDDIFRIASQSKAITSTAVMMLWEEGKFRLDDPVSKFIPEFKNPQVLESFRYSDTSYTTIPAEREITIRDLLTHTSGIGYGIIDGDERFKMIYQKNAIVDLFTNEDITIEENIKRLAKLPLHHHPGEKFTYSEGLDVLGYLVEIMSGMKFNEFLRLRLFDPLGMDDTWFYLPQGKADRLVPVQTRENDSWVKYTNPHYDVNYPVKGAKSFFSGGAGLSSTAEDYAVFLQMYLNEGEYNGVRILSRTTVRTIMSNQINTLWDGDSYYGLAFGVVNQKGEALGGIGSEGTFNWGGYFNTQYFADPKEGVIGILMKQTQGQISEQTGWKFRLLVGQAIDD